jgi:hypothetical protein
VSSYLSMRIAGARQIPEGMPPRLIERSEICIQTSDSREKAVWSANEFHVEKLDRFRDRTFTPRLTTLGD